MGAEGTCQSFHRRAPPGIKSYEQIQNRYVVNRVDLPETAVTKNEVLRANLFGTLAARHPNLALALYNSLKIMVPAG